jgi:hypothetical protein
LIRGLSQRHVQMIAIAGAIVRSPLGADLGFEFADIRGGDV